jgi:hypothetical protein
VAYTEIMTGPVVTVQVDSGMKYLGGDLYKT